MRDAVLVLAPQAERRADLGAGRVAAALAAGDHDDPAPDVVALMPDAARADDARVVVRMGPLAHHVDLHGLVGRVRRRLRPWSRRRETRRAPQGPRRNASSPLILAPLRTTSNTRCAVRYSRLSARVKFAATTLMHRENARRRRRLAALLVAPASASAAPLLRRRSSTRDSVRYGAEHRTHRDAARRHDAALAGQEIVLEGRRYPYEGSYRVIARTTTDAEGKFELEPSSTATTACASPRPLWPDFAASCGPTCCPSSSSPSARCGPASCGSTSATRCPRACG